MDGGPKRRNIAAFSNFSGEAWTGPVNLRLPCRVGVRLKLWIPKPL